MLIRIVVVKILRGHVMNDDHWLTLGWIRFVIADAPHLVQVHRRSGVESLMMGSQSSHRVDTVF